MHRAQEFSSGFKLSIDRLMSSSIVRKSCKWEAAPQGPVSSLRTMEHFHVSLTEGYQQHPKEREIGRRGYEDWTNLWLEFAPWLVQNGRSEQARSLARDFVHHSCSQKLQGLVSQPRQHTVNMA